jgi:post-segregation antitoxin (ccd killing protein)
MATEKISVTVDTEVLAQARRIAGERPLSALVNEALDRVVRLDAGRRAVAQYEDEHGAFSDAEREWAKAYLDDPRSRIPDDELRRSIRERDGR